MAALYYNYNSGLRSVQSSPLREFNWHERGAYRGMTDEFEGMGSGDVDNEVNSSLNSSLSVTRGKRCADCMVRAVKWASAISDHDDGRPETYHANIIFFYRFDRDVKAHVTGAASVDGISGLGNLLIYRFTTRK